MPQAVDRDRDAVAQSDLELRRGRTRRGDASARLFAGGTTRWQMLMSAAAETTDQEAGVGVFMQALHQLGWTEDRNVRLKSDGAEVILRSIADTRKSWSRFRRTLLW
jgi:hypothetical protein